MNQAPDQSEAVYLKGSMARPIATEETYMVLCRPLDNGKYVLEYVSRGDSRLLTAVLVDK